MPSRELKKGSNQVWLYCSRLPLPLSLIAIHCWFEISDRNNVVNRWEVWHKRISNKKRWGYLYKDLLPLNEGIDIFPGYHFLKWPSKKLFYFENQIATDLIDVIKASPNNYPLQHLYRAYPGPNSNTYIQWVLNQINTGTIVLPFSALGKNWIR